MEPMQPPDTTHPADKNVRAIARLEQAVLHERSRIDRLSEAITNAAATPWFIAVHATMFGGWILANSLVAEPVDPYPFSLLTLAVSLEVIFLTGFVLMSQSRMARQADKRAHLDLQVNLLAEQELTAMLGMLRALCERFGVSADTEPRVDEMLKETDIQKLSSALDRELRDSKESARRRDDHG